MVPVDHLVYAARDLDRAVDALEHRLGVRATPGGRHPEEGTWNAVIGVGPEVYLEIIAPDPDRPPPPRPRWFGLDDPGADRIVAWAAKVSDLPRRRAAARDAGLTLGEVRSGTRRRPDGTLLSWTFTDPHTVIGDGLIPFLIDWGSSPHPARQTPGGVELVGLRGEHPAPGALIATLGRLGLELPVTPSPRPALIATLMTPNGPVELR
jgi:glyoxalase-like protein